MQIISIELERLHRKINLYGRCDDLIVDLMQALKPVGRLEYVTRGQVRQITEKLNSSETDAVETFFKAVNRYVKMRLEDRLRTLERLIAKQRAIIEAKGIKGYNSYE